MSTLAIFDPLEELAEREPVQCCRFCGCTEDSPCGIPITEELNGTFRLARSEAETTETLPCNWYLPGVCNSPACVEKLIAESRVLLFGADGSRVA
jgi:hypothetical protein